MGTLDFKEIPQANISNGQQDTFEIFAREALEMMGFEINSFIDRGPDGGRDILVNEKRTGISGITTIKWLVSCKHKAHSGKSVTISDETDITDRLQTNGANGFMGFYSTIISSALSNKLKELKNKYNISIFDHGHIEKFLLESPTGREIAKRYFPKSYSAWENTYQKPSNLFNEYYPLKCKHCGKDLLHLDAPQGIIAFVEECTKGVDENTNNIVDIYWSCKGNCDRVLEKSYRSGLITKWEDITDIIIPSRYLSWNMAIINRIYDGTDKYSKGAFKKLREFICSVSQLTLRNQSEDQIRRFKDTLLYTDGF
ncbi:MAG: restriction endonuclease [Candidatus Margulisbacteria bacterium]|nr:restriction endonuclease [Candidatus Margulisiibacteriota bacterium]